jgi:hypothetical protein
MHAGYSLTAALCTGGTAPCNPASLQPSVQALRHPDTPPAAHRGGATGRGARARMERRGAWRQKFPLHTPCVVPLCWWAPADQQWGGREVPVAHGGWPPIRHEWVVSISPPRRDERLHARRRRHVRRVPRVRVATELIASVMCGRSIHSRPMKHAVPATESQFWCARRTVGKLQSAREKITLKLQYVLHSLCHSAQAGLDSRK